MKPDLSMLDSLSQRHRSSQSDPKEQANSSRWLTYVVLAGILVLGLAARSTLVVHNLPVAWHVDERFLLRVLERFSVEDTLDPNFFQYPTLYLYINHFALSPFLGLEDYLWGGRALNLVFVGLLTCAAFALSNELFGSKRAGVLAAAATLFSPTMILSASYLSTDTLLSLFCIVSVWLLTRFFHRQRDRDWFFGVLFLGLAIATKYSAVSLLIAYLIYELFQPASEWSSPSEPGSDHSMRRFCHRILQASIPKAAMNTLLLIGCVFMLLAYALFPREQLLALVGSSGDLNSTIDASDRAFLDSIRNKCMMFALALGSIAFAGYLVPQFSLRIRRVRPLLAIGIAWVTLLLTSPYMIFSWKKFAYDFGALMKNSAGGTEPQWIPYFQRYFAMESILLLALFAVGLWVAYRQKRNIQFPLLYLGVSYAIIGGAGSGYPRYLAPLLPVLLVIATWALIACSTVFAKKFHASGAAVWIQCGLVLGVGLEFYPKVLARLDLPFNEMRASYDYVIEHKPSMVYFSTCAPDVEFRMAGIAVKEIPSSSLSANDPSLVDGLLPTEILILSGEQVKRLSPSVREKLELLLSAVKNQESTKDQDILSDQYVFARLPH